MYIFSKKKIQQEKVKSCQTPSRSSSWSLIPSLGTMSLPHWPLTPFSFNALLLQNTHFIFLFIYFNWRLITLQYCDGFCHTLTWISHGCACVPHPEPPLPPPSPSHPSGSSQCTGPECPVSCIQPGLAICFTYVNIHVSMLFSHIIPPLPSPTVQLTITIFLNSIYMH